jgi:hypothetical protein
MSVFRSLATSVPKNLAIRHQTPTLIGCIFLRILAQNLSFCTSLAAISGAFDYDMLFNNLSTVRVFQPAQTSQPAFPTPSESPNSLKFAARFELSLEL